MQEYVTYTGEKLQRPKQAWIENEFDMKSSS